MTMFIQAQSSKKIILIVDDISENLDVLKGILSPHYRVKVATSGRLALKVGNVFGPTRYYPVGYHDARDEWL